MQRSVPGIVLSLLLAVPARSATLPARLGLEPADRAEVALREAMAKRRTLADLRAVSAQHAGTTVSGLAQIAAGFAAMGSANPAEALVCFRHKDVSATEIADVAGFGEAEALEATNGLAAAAEAYARSAALRPGGALSCEALLRSAELYLRFGDPTRAASVLEGTTPCPPSSRLLARSAETAERSGNLERAAAAYERLDGEYPASDEAVAAETRLKALTHHLPRRSPAEHAQRALDKALAVYEARDYRRVVTLLRGLSATGENRWLVATRLGRALAATGRTKEAQRVLSTVPRASTHAAEAAYHRARLRSGKTELAALRGVADRFPGTPWAEDALLAVASDAERDGDVAGAVALYRRLLKNHPDGRYVDRAVRRVTWADYKAGRLVAAATTLEAAARERSGNAVAGFLFWAGRARADLGQLDRARTLLEETVRRFKAHYYGIRARETLASLSPRPAPLLSAPVESRLELPEPTLDRVRQLVLIEQYQEAVAELERLPASTATQAAIAWIESARGQLRPAIAAMRKAFPEYLGEGGELLPDDVWRVLYPLEFRESLEEKARLRGLDPALVAALVCQESTFDTNAISRAGARGLMQIMPSTGRGLARSLGRAFQTLILHEPETSLDLGTLYFSRMLQRFDGRVERSLAAYNAGPSRVDEWTAKSPGMSAEEFIETIPFQETRFYVMTILANQAQYRRLYWTNGEATTSANRP